MMDLHVHTVHSDGSSTPKEILTEAEERGIKLLSITDHNSVGAYAELQTENVRNIFSGEIITGVEFTTILFGQVIEILGYGFQLEPIRQFIEECYGSQEEFMRRELRMIYADYQKKGVRIQKDESLFSPREHGTAKQYIFSELAREENRKFFRDADNQKSFNGYIRSEIYNPDSPLYVDYSKILPSSGDIIEAIHKAGGQTFLAHCFIYTERIWNHLDEVLENVPVDGIEVWYSSFTTDQERRVKTFCEQNGLRMSGGSDYHGKMRASIQLGNQHMDDTMIYEWADQIPRY